VNTDQVWLQYRKSIKAFLHSRVSDPTEVDDLLQDVLIRTHQKLHTIDDDASTRAWLFTVANNAIIDFYRKRARARDIDASDLWYSVDDASIEEELSQCVEPFIKALPEDTAQLITAIDLEGQSQKEYAAEHGISYSTLKSRVQKGRTQLRALFDNCCQFKLDKSGNLIDYDPKSRDCGDC